MDISTRGLALTKLFEGLRLAAYRDSVGVLTIGYGHTGPDVQRGQTITEAEADAYLLADMRVAIVCVNAWVKVAVTQGQFDALCDFCYNAGQGALHGSTLLAKVNAEDFDGAAEQFGEWVHAGGEVLEGLVKRRAAEAAMFKGESE